MSIDLDYNAAQVLIAQGYRTTSRKYGIVTRIDREDWWEFLEQEFQQNMPIRNEGETGRWGDFYRRTYSEDKLEMGPQVSQHIPTSCHDPVGYIKKT